MTFLINKQGQQASRAYILLSLMNKENFLIGLKTMAI